MKRRVVKVGGSLLAIPELGAKLCGWLSRNAEMQSILVVGGGEVVDVIRRLEESQNLTDQQSHELACRALSLTAKVVACSVAEAEFCDRIETLRESTSAIVIFDSSTWILGKDDVPATWEFTSDSIAARLACELDAEELVLMKSRMGSVEEPGFVDACFADESKPAKSIRVCTLNE